MDLQVRLQTLIDAACRVLSGMATFAEAGVSGSKG